MSVAGPLGTPPLARSSAHGTDPARADGSSTEERPPTDAALGRAALLVVAGVVSSGPLAQLFTWLTCPQPSWRGAETFIAHYHPLQALPFAFGFVLIAGGVLFVARCAARADARHRVAAGVALVAAAVYAALVTTNYALQTAVLSSAVRSHDAALVALVTMSNPRSPCWAIEMFGYGALGVATWLVAGTFERGPYARWVRRLLVANGVVSVAGAAITAWRLEWVLSPTGLLFYVLWNALVLVTMVFVVLDARTFAPQRAIWPIRPDW